MIRKFEFYFLACLLTGLLAATLNWALKGAIHYQKNVLVPDLIGKTLQETLDLLSKQNLGIKKEGEEFNDNFPQGTVLRQQPQAGLTVRESKVIRVTLSQGSETAFVPELVGQSLRSAEILLRSNLLALGELRTQPSIRFDKDIVISQEPASRKIVSKNTLVHITISEGAPQDGTILMPDFSGKNWKEVLSWAKDLEIEAISREDANYISDAETVLSQEIFPDTPIQRKNTVRFVISSAKGGAFSGKDASNTAPKFHYEVPQGESPKQYVFELVDSFGKREIWRGKLEPGTKHAIPLPPKVNPSSRVRIFVDGILTEERPVY